MKHTHFLLVADIRRARRNGATTRQLVARFDLEELTIRQIITARTREGAAKVLADRQHSAAAASTVSVTHVLTVCRNEAV